MERHKGKDNKLCAKNYKLIALDIDGTLINSKQVLTGRTRRALEAAKAAGIKVTIATGRHYNSAATIARMAGINAPMVCNDGALIADINTGEILAKHLLPLEVALEVLDIAQEYENLHLQVFTIDEKIYAGKNYRLDMARKFFRSPQRINFRGIYNFFKAFVFVPVRSTGDIEGAKAALKEPPAKVLVYGDAYELEEFTERVTTLFQGQISITTAIVNCIDILKHGVSKAKGLKELGEKLGIRPEEIVTVGDNINDLEMLEFAGMGVAMGNAVEEVKNRADYITKSNDEDGVAYFVEKLLGA